MFTFWCLLKEEHLFKSYIALSPSLWKNRYNLFDYEEAYHQHHNALPAYLYLSAGRREHLNFVLHSVRRMKAVLDERAYKGLKLDYFEHPGKNHHTQVPVSWKWVLRHVAF